MRYAPAAALLTFFTAAALAQAPIPAPAAAPEPSLPYTVKPSDKLIRLSRDLLVTPGAMPDGDFKTNLAYPQDLQPRRRDTGHGLYALLGIARNDHAAREQQMRRNFEFFGAPTVLFVFVHAGLREFSVLDAGIWLQSLMLSAQAHGLATCAQGALATWAGPVRAAFDVPPHYKLICGVSIGAGSAFRRVT